LVEYKFNEDTVLQELKEYIDSTYMQHYGKSKFQTTEFVFDAGHGEGFCIGNIIKYAQRYGKKNGHNPADLLKIIHYAIFLLGENKESSYTEQYNNGNNG
jgi:hypothetical protein